MKPLPHDKLRPSAVSMVKRLQNNGFTAYWAGGCVRDLHLGRIPKDYDIATNATPDQTIAIFPNAVAVGKSFGVVKVPVNGEEFDIATFRQDKNYADGRHPEAVTFSTPEEDASRRDFTINALFYDPVSDQLHDYVGGIDDLKRGLIKCVGEPEKRFKEDYLRMLRAVRFASTLEFDLTAPTADVIRQHAPLITQISAERIQNELSRTLVEAKNSGDALVMLDDVRILQNILPEVTDMKGQEQPPQFHPEGDVFQHTVIMLNMMREKSLHLAYAVLLHDLGKPITATDDGDRIRFNCHAEKGAELAKKILIRLKLPNRDIEPIVYCIKNHMRFIDVQKMRKSTLRRLAGSDTFDLEMELHWLDCASSHGKLDNYEFLLKFKEEIDSEPVLPERWITGHDIIEMGISEGPEIGKWRRKAYDAQLNELFKNKTELMNWLRNEVLSRIQ